MVPQSTDFRCERTRRKQYAPARRGIKRTGISPLIWNDYTLPIRVCELAWTLRRLASRVSVQSLSSQLPERPYGHVYKCICGEILIHDGNPNSGSDRLETRFLDKHANFQRVWRWELGVDNQ